MIERKLLYRRIIFTAAAECKLKKGPTGAGLDFEYFRTVIRKSVNAMDGKYEE